MSRRPATPAARRQLPAARQLPAPAAGELPAAAGRYYRPPPELPARRRPATTRPRPRGTTRRPPPGYGAYSGAPGNAVGQLPQEAYTSWLTRVGAYLIDFLPVLVLYGIPSMIAGTTADRECVSSSTGFECTVTPSSAGATLMFLGWLAALIFGIWNFGYRQGTTGSSIGKSVLKFKVVSDPPASRSGSACHWCASWPTWSTASSGIGYLFPLWDAKRQTIADKIMSTVCLPMPVNPNNPHCTAGLSTTAIHAGFRPDPRPGRSTCRSTPVRTFAQDGVGGLRGGFEYARTGNPTRAALETALAAVEQGRFGRAFGSGMAATDCALRAMLRPGDHLVIPDDAYGGTFRLIDKVFTQWGVEPTPRSRCRISTRFARRSPAPPG